MKVGGYKIMTDNSKMVLMELFNSVVETSGKRENREHHHTQFEISLFKAGSGRYTVGNKEYAFEKDDVFLFSTHEQHCITQIDSEEGIVLMNIQFEPRFVWSASNDMFDSKFLGFFFNRNSSFENRLDRNNPTTAVIRKLMLDMECEFQEKKTEYELMTKVILLNILVLLMRDYGYTEKYQSYHLDPESLLCMEHAIEYIDRHLTEELTLEEISKRANMSKAYFCTVFKKLNGITAWDYITTKRVELAMKMIKNANMTMLETACSCGFNNTANFNRAFKKITGLMPSQYRKKQTIDL